MLSAIIFYVAVAIILGFLFAVPKLTAMRKRFKQMNSRERAHEIGYAKARVSTQAGFAAVVLVVYIAMFTLCYCYGLYYAAGVMVFWMGVMACALSVDLGRYLIATAKDPKVIEGDMQFA